MKKNNEFETNEGTYKYLQNIAVDIIKNIKANELNTNVLMNKMLFSKRKDNKSSKIESIQIGCIEQNKRESLSEYPNINRKIPQELSNYLESIKQYCCNMGLEIISENIDMEIQDKLIAGLGNPNVSETSMTLHHIYGVPYLPGQALKGLFKSYIIREIMKNDDIEKIKLNTKYDDSICKNKFFKLLFGVEFKDQELDQHNNVKSNIVFFDSFPIEKYEIEKDIINTHYKEYYNQKDFPKDTENPNLVFFYVVKNTKFKILSALNEERLKKSISKKKSEYKIFQTALQSIIIELLCEALEENGIGAKTSSGYGYLKLISKYRINEEYEEKNKSNEEEKMNKMSKVERIMYEIEISKIDKKNELIANLIRNLSENNEYNEKEKRILAKYAKDFYIKTNKWKIKKKYIRMNERINIICQILNCQLPE